MRKTRLYLFTKIKQIIDTTNMINEKDCVLVGMFVTAKITELKAMKLGM